MSKDQLLKRRAKIAGITAAIVVGGFVVSRFWREPDLLVIATKYVPYKMHEWDVYSWATNDRVMFNHCMKSANAPSHWTFLDWQFGDGHVTPMEALSAPLRTRIGQMVFHEMEISPKGDWLAAKMIVRENSAAAGNVMHGYRIGLIRTNGRDFHMVKVRDVEDPYCWSSGGTELICARRDPNGNGTRIESHPSDGHGVARMISMPSAKDAFRRWSHMIAMPNEKFRLVLSDMEPEPTEREEIDVADISAGESSAPPILTTVRLPRPSFILEKVLSPDGKRIAVSTQSENRNPVLSTIHKVLPSVGVHTTWTTTVWICSVKGSNTRLVGSVTGPNDRDYPQKVAWRPNGRQLSFLYKGAFWTVDAP